MPNDSSAARPANGLPAAVLFDMDGTLVETEPYWMRAERELVAEHGGTWTHEDALGAVGQALLTTGTMRGDAGVPLEPAEIVTWLVDRVNEQLADAVPWRPGAPELLDELRAAGIPCAIVTMSYRSQAQVGADGAPAGTFAHLVTGDEVGNGKPHPEPYLVGADLFGVRPEDCVAVEDSGPGITSALASGARTLGIPAEVPVPRRPGLSRAASLKQIDLAVLRRIAAGEVVDLLG